MLAVSVLEASAQTDSLFIDATTVTARKAEAAVVQKLSGVVMDVPALNTMPSLLGSADPVTYAQYLPSMSTRTELEAGIHIQGNDHQHNMVSSGGVPIYGASHLLGLFSVFNPSHYGTMRYRTWVPEVNRLGGSLDMVLPEKLPETIGGDFQLGLIAAQGSLAAPVGEKAGVRVSARRSFINLLYGGFLKLDEAAVRYGFTDVNLTAQWNPGSKDKLWLDAYWGNDAAACDAGFYGADITTAWQNAMAALHWRHAGNLEQTLYYTGWGLNLDAAWNAMSAGLESSLGTAGYKASLKLGDWTMRAETAWHNAQPQNPTIHGGVSTADISQAPQWALENTLSGRYAHIWGPFTLEAGLKGTLYYMSGNWLKAVDPDLMLGWNLYRGGQLALRIGTQHQYLFQTGMTDLGMPSEFWFLAGDQAAPQMARSASLGYMLDFGQGAYRLSAEAYYKALEGQVEYKGNIMEFMNTAYSLDKVLLHGRGRAYGLNLSVNKLSGPFTGWISYAWGRSLRSFDDPSYPAEYPSSHERIHELDAVASYNIGPWTFGASVVAASGTPYTAPENLYLMAGCIVASYGEHNASRLKPYFRADASVNYFFRRGANESGLNLSIYNVTGTENELYCSLWMDRETRMYRYKGTGLQIKFMPSLSYFRKF